MKFLLVVFYLLSDIVRVEAGCWGGPGPFPKLESIEQKEGNIEIEYSMQCSNESFIARFQQQSPGKPCRSKYTFIDDDGLATLTVALHMIRSEHKPDKYPRKTWLNNQQINKASRWRHERTLLAQATYSDSRGSQFGKRCLKAKR